MSKTLKLDTLKGFKPKGVNVDKAIIESALKEFSEVEETITKKEEPSSPSISILMEDRYREEIEKLKTENERLKLQVTDVDNFPQIKSRKLRNNLSRFIEAIKIESSLQGTKWPILSTNKLRKIYKVTADSFKECLSYALTEGLIDRKEKSYSGNVTTWSYTIIDK